MRMKKIAIVSSAGGHLSNALELLDAFLGHEFFFCTYPSVRDKHLMSIAKVYFTDNIGYSIRKMMIGFLFAWRVLRQEKPDVILSLGSEIALPFFYFGKLMGIRTIYIEDWCRVSSRSLTGIMLYPIADEFWVQWPDLKNKYGPKAKYKGAII